MHPVFHLGLLLQQSQVIRKKNLFSSSPLLCTYFHVYSSSATFSNENPSPSPRINNKDAHPHNVSAMSVFLVEGLGLSQSQILTVKKLYPDLFRPTPNPLKRAQDVLSLFKEHGFSDAQIRYLVSRQPRILSYRADENLRPKLEMLKSLGLKEDDLGHVVSRGRRILGVKDLDSSVQYYKSLFQGNANLLKALKKYPSLLGSNVNTTDKQIKFLKQQGMPDDSIFRMTSLVPRLLSASTEATELRIQYFRSLGVSTTSKNFAVILARSISYSVNKMEEKMRVLEALGLSDRKVKEVVGKCPDILYISSQKIKKIAEYLAQIGVPLDEALKNPVILRLSLEKKIKPRHDVFMFLKESSHFKTEPPLRCFFMMSERMFLEKHVNNHPQRLELLSLLGRDKDAYSKVSEQ